MRILLSIELLVNFPKDVEIPIKYKNPKRNLEHFLSRLTLSKLTRPQQNNFIHLELQQYQFLNEEPESVFSLAHTKDAALGIKANKSHFQSIGCDIENKNRAIPTDSTHHFINEQDEPGELNLLAKWCIKEACFKALSNQGRPIKLLKQVVIKDNYFKFIEDDKFDPKNRFYFFDYPEYLVVVAYCAKTEDSIEYKLINKEN